MSNGDDERLGTLVHALRTPLTIVEGFARPARPPRRRHVRRGARRVPRAHRRRRARDAGSARRRALSLGARRRPWPVPPVSDRPARAAGRGALDLALALAEEPPLLGRGPPRGMSPGTSRARTRRDDRDDAHDDHVDRDQRRRVAVRGEERGRDQRREAARRGRTPAGSRASAGVAHARAEHLASRTRPAGRTSGRGRR